MPSDSFVSCANPLQTLSQSTVLLLDQVQGEVVTREIKAHTSHIFPRPCLQFITLPAQP
jgi:hypothetical protein